MEAVRILLLFFVAAAPFWGKKSERVLRRVMIYVITERRNLSFLCFLSFESELALQKNGYIEVA
jgi:hypothetical protein